MFRSAVQEGSAFYAPQKEKGPPASALDDHQTTTKLFIVLTCVFIELAIYAGMTFYYAETCSKQYGASTCAYATDRKWAAAIVNTPGLRYLSCYDTSGAAKGTSLTEALAAGGNYDDVAGCEVYLSATGEVWDDDDQYNPQDCCNGWFHEDDCTPADFCHNTLLMCEWEICRTPLEVFSLANGAMAGIHVIFFYIVAAAIAGAGGKKKKLTPATGGADATQEVTEMVPKGGAPIAQDEATRTDQGSAF